MTGAVRMVERVSGVFSAGRGHGAAGAEAAQLSMLANLAAIACVIVSDPKVTRGFDGARMRSGPHVRVSGAAIAPFAPEVRGAWAAQDGANKAQGEPR